MKIYIVFVCLMLTRMLSAEQLYVVCSVPELADMVKVIGGEFIEAEALVRPKDNPHFLSARPSFIRKIAHADAFVVVGMDLEVGWAPALIKSARNQRIQIGKHGYIDCSAAISALEVPTERLDRSYGDVHPHGNPHYLLSPVCGLQVLHYLAEKLAQLDPSHAHIYRANAESARDKLAQQLYGEQLVTAHGIDELIAWHLVHTLHEQIGETPLGGWMADLHPLVDVAFIDDHKQWAYVADCFGLDIVAHLEPKAGIPPSSQHLKKVIAGVDQYKVRGIITAPWFDSRHAQFVAQATKAPVVKLAHQAGAIAGTLRYQDFCAYNVEQLKVLVVQP